MLRKDFAQLQTKISEAAHKLCTAKGDDYAGEDNLSNFKRMTALCGILGVSPINSPGDSARFLLLLKLDRWFNLRRKRAVPMNESIRDTILDLHNYIDLAYACDLEEEECALPMKHR